MDVVSLLLVLGAFIVIGIIFWLLQSLIAKAPMDPQFKTIAQFALYAVAVGFLIWLLLGLLGLGGVRLPKLKL